MTEFENCGFENGNFDKPDIEHLQRDINEQRIGKSDIKKSCYCLVLYKGRYFSLTKSSSAGDVLCHIKTFNNAPLEADVLEDFIEYTGLEVAKK